MCGWQASQGAHLEDTTFATRLGPRIKAPRPRLPPPHELAGHRQARGRGASSTNPSIMPSPSVRLMRACDAMRGLHNAATLQGHLSKGTGPRALAQKPARPQGSPRLVPALTCMAHETQSEVCTSARASLMWYVDASAVECWPMGQLLGTASRVPAQQRCCPVPVAMTQAPPPPKAANQLDALRQMSVVVADTGDIAQIRRYAPIDVTTNPTLIFKVTSPACKELPACPAQQVPGACQPLTRAAGRPAARPARPQAIRTQEYRDLLARALVAEQHQAPGTRRAPASCGGLCILPSPGQDPSAPLLRSLSSAGSFRPWRSAWLSTWVSRCSSSSRAGSRPRSSCCRRRSHASMHGLCVRWFPVSVAYTCLAACRWTPASRTTPRRPSTGLSSLWISMQRAASTPPGSTSR
jgi:hypothetical protein